MFFSQQTASETIAQLRENNKTDSYKLFKVAIKFLGVNYNFSDFFDFEALQAGYDEIVSSFVNDASSEFYIYG